MKLNNQGKNNGQPNQILQVSGPWSLSSLTSCSLLIRFETVAEGESALSVDRKVGALAAVYYLYIYCKTYIRF